MKTLHDDDGNGGTVCSSGGATVCGSDSLFDAATSVPHALTPVPLRQTLRGSSEIVLSFDELAVLDDFDAHHAQAPLDFAYLHNLSLSVPLASAHDYQHVQQLTPIAQRRGDCADFGGGFFHLQTGGALRKGGPVALLSRQYGGYALSAAWSGYMYVMIEFVLMRVAPERLGLRSAATASSLKDLLRLQWSVVLFLGLLSDALAPCGLRRNAYILGGWALVSASFAALFVLLQTMDSLAPQTLSAASVACVTVAMLFLVVLTNATDIRVVELAQQETLATRGQLVATYQLLRIGAQVLAHTLIKALLPVRTGTSDVVLEVSPLATQLLVLHLAVLALIPIPFILHHAFEPKLHTTTAARPAATQFGETCRQFLRSAQQQAIWQLVALNCVLYFFSFLEHRDVARALAIWTQQPPRTRLTQSLLADLAFVAVLAAWRTCGGVNAHWRKSIAVVVLSWTAVYATGNALVALNVARAQPWLPVLLAVLKAPFRVLLLFSAFIPTVEVAQLGSEGTIYGLLSSFQSVVKVLGTQLADAVVARGGASIEIDMAKVTANAPSASTRVFYWVLALAAIKLLALLALCFCPRQKLDAQQRRIYGGYSKCALSLFVLLYALSYPYASYTQYSALHV